MSSMPETPCVHTHVIMPMSMSLVLVRSQCPVGVSVCYVVRVCIALCWHVEMKVSRVE